MTAQMKINTIEIYQVRFLNFVSDLYCRTFHLDSTLSLNYILLTFSLDFNETRETAALGGVSLALQGNAAFGAHLGNHRLWRRFRSKNIYIYLISRHRRR